MKITPVVFAQAIQFAHEKHAGAFRKSNKTPYIVHPFSVMERVFTYKEESDNLFLLGTVALLHDTVEDTDTTVEDIALKFGYSVASIVEELTTDKEECDKVGKQTYLAGKMCNMSSYALVVKLCDRLDNISDLEKMDDEFIKRYTGETLHILTKLKLSGRKLTRTHNMIITDIMVGLDKYIDSSASVAKE